MLPGRWRLVRDDDLSELSLKVDTMNDRLEVLLECEKIEVTIADDRSKLLLEWRLGIAMTNDRPEVLALEFITSN